MDKAQPTIAGDWFERHPSAEEIVPVSCPDCFWPLLHRAVAVSNGKLHMLLWCPRDLEHFEYEERP